MASRSTNTMQEALSRLMREIADMKLLTDADLPWLVQVESMIISRMKQPVEALVQQGQLPPGPESQMMMGSPAGSMQGGGMMAGTQAPSGDELQRFLSAGAPGL